MKKILNSLGVFVSGTIVMLTLAMCTGRNLDNTFYAQNTLYGFNNAPQTAGEKARLLKTTGYDGLEGFGYQDFFELQTALEQEGLTMPVNYAELNFEADGIPEKTSDGQIREMIKASAKGSVIYFHLHSKSYVNDRVAGDRVVAAILRELADYAGRYGVKLGVYPHIAFYCETVAHSVRIARLVDRDNYGAVMNLCHLLKVEGSEGIDDKIREYAPLLVAVNICGADDGNTREMDWNRLIQPLGEGSFDTYHFVKMLKDNGYDGPIGLQCYNLQGDAAETLTRSLKTWKEYQKRYAEGQPKH